MRTTARRMVALVACTAFLAAVPVGDAPATTGPDRIWQGSVMTDPSGRIYVMPQALEVDPKGERVYVLMYAWDWDRRDVPVLVALDAASGREVWRWRQPGLQIRDLAVGPGGTRLYLAGGDWRGVWHTLAVRAADGSVIWDEAFQPPGPYEAMSVAVSPDDTTVYTAGDVVTTETRRMRATVVSYRANDGARLWKTRIGDGFFELWTSDLVVAPGNARVALGALYEGTKGDPCRPAVAALRARDGGIAWVRAEETKYTPGVCDGHTVSITKGSFLSTLTFGSAGGKLAGQSLSRSDGSERWTRVIDDLPWPAGPAIASGRVAYTGYRYGTAACPDQGDARLLVLSARTGRTMWSRRYGCGSPSEPAFSPDGHRLFIVGWIRIDGRYVGYLASVRASDGVRIWTTTLTGLFPDTSLDFARVGPSGNRVFVAGLTWDSPSGGEARDNGTVIAGYRT